MNRSFLMDDVGGGYHVKNPPGIQFLWEEKMKLQFDPEYVPDAAECSSLTNLTKMPGYSVIHRIMKSVVDQYHVEMREADTELPAQCVERIRRAQVASDVYQTMVDRVNTYVSVYVDAVNAGSNPIDPDGTSELGMDYKDIETEADSLTSYFDFEESAV